MKARSGPSSPEIKLGGDPNDQVERGFNNSEIEDRGETRGCGVCLGNGGPSRKTQGGIPHSVGTNSMASSHPSLLI